MKQRLSKKERTILAHNLKIDDLFDTGADKQIAKVQELFDWMDKHGGRIPPTNNKFNSYISRLRNARKGLIRKNYYINTNECKLYLDTIKFVNNSKYPRIFENNNRVYNQVQYINDICNWINSHNGEYPKQTANNLIERQLSVKLSYLRNAYNASDNSHRLYPESIDYLKQHKMLYILENVRSSNIQLNKVIILCNWIKLHGMYPSSRNPVYKTLVYIRDLYSTDYIKYPDIFKYLKKNNMLYILKSNAVHYQLKSVTSICKWIKTTGIRPTVASNNIVEKTLGSKLCKLRQVYKGTFNGNIYPETIKFLKQKKMLHILKPLRSDK